MQQTVFWKYWLFLGIFEISLLTAPVWSQPAASTNAPAAGADAKSWVDYGVASGSKGDLDAAIRAFNQAISIDPKYAPAYCNRGIAYSLLNKQDEALADISQAIQIDPKYKDAYFKRGSMKGQQGDFDAAISDFNQVIQLDAKYAPAYYQLGHAKYFKGDLDGASDNLNQALSLDPNSPWCYFVRGLVRHAHGHREEAISDFQKSAGLNFPNAAFWVWITEMESAEHGLARKDLTDALNKPEAFRPDDWPSQIGNYLLEKITQSELLDKAKTGNDVETNQRLCQAWFYCGIHSLLSGDAKGAKEFFASAVATGAKGMEEFVEANRELSTAFKQ